MHALLCWPRSSNGAYVYVKYKAYFDFSVFLYLYRDPKTGELVWVFGRTWDPRYGAGEVNDPRYSANTKDNFYAYFDSSPSAKGACALNGPAAPACKWRECGAKYACGSIGHPHSCQVGQCYAYPRKGTGAYTTWYGASDRLKVVVGGKGGH